MTQATIYTARGDQGWIGLICFCSYHVNFENISWLLSSKGIQGIAQPDARLSFGGSTT